METLERIEYKGHLIEIYPDHDCESPLEADLMPRFAFWHRNYKNPATEYPDPEAVYQAVQEGAVAFPVWAYEHGGIAFTVTGAESYPFNDVFDSGFAGFLVYPKELLPELGDPSPEGLLRAAQATMEEFTAYSNGWGQGYRIFLLPPDVEEIDELDSDDLEEVDACWGFLDQDYCEKTAKEQIDAMTEEAA